jgi:hypothetical protein
MNSPRFTLNWYDLVKGLQMYLITTILMSLGSVILTPGFSVFSADWLAILMNTVDVAVISTVSYLVKNFITDTSVL